MQTNQSIFSGRRALLATKHGKEAAVAPALRESFEIEVVSARNLDTDVLGTFSGEIERKGTPLETAREKIEMAARLYPDHDLFLASEGSFGSHPSSPFLPYNTELIMLVDKRNGIEIIGQYGTTSTNMAGKDVGTLAEAIEFAGKVGFPGHAVIIKTGKGKPGKGLTFKDLNNSSALEVAVRFALSGNGGQPIHIETDMRADRNPTRMESIRMAVMDLISNMKSLCPECEWPGFTVTERVPGLPCANCGLPTRATLKYILRCNHCGYTEDKLYPNGKEQEDPTYCDHCNP